MLLNSSLVYIERLFLVILVGVMCGLLMIFDEQRAATQSVYTLGLVGVTYFIGERSGSLDITSSATYLNVSVLIVYVMSFVFFFYVTVAVDLGDRPGREEVWCQLSIISCGLLYCGAKIGVGNVVIERLRLIRNNALCRFSDFEWKLSMSLLLPYLLCLLFLLLDSIHILKGIDCLIGIERRALIMFLCYNTATTVTLCLLFLREFTNRDPNKVIRIPRGMSQLSVVSVSIVWMFCSWGVLIALVVEVKLKEYVYLLIVMSDVFVGMLVADYLSGLTVARMHRGEMATTVAERVSTMDFDDIDYLFEAENPTLIQSSFKTITTILREYKSYVPAAVLENASDIINTEAPAAITPPEGEVAVVFTDIISSSVIWSEIPVEMREALRIHNSVIRSCMIRNGGYEVKTIGDAFMVVFETADKALQFALDTHTELFKSTWPEQLKLLEPCKCDKVWNGLRLRIGIMHGEVTCELNNSTGRFDYRGSPVSLASRLEGYCDHGGIAISESSLSQCNYTIEHSDPLIIDKGEVRLKDIKHLLKLFVVYPRQLAARADRLTVNKSKKSGALTNSPTSSISSTTSGIALRKKHLDDSGLKKVSATIGRQRVRLLPAEYTSINEAFSLITTCLIRTDGITLAVTGNVITFSWNSSKPVEKHALAALRFVDLYASYQRRRQDWVPQSVLAISTSSNLHSGSVTAGGEKFITLLGDALSITISQLQIAEKREVFCTYTSSDVKNVVYFQPILRELTDVKVNQLSVYEVSTCGWAGRIEKGYNGSELLLEEGIFPFTEVEDVASCNSMLSLGVNPLQSRRLTPTSTF